MSDPERDSRSDDGPIVGPEDILGFWFGPAAATPLANATKWYTKDKDFDHEVGERFGPALELAARGGLASWKTSPRGRLALVLLLDQFSRNVHRDTARAFAQDVRACGVALEAIEEGDEGTLSTVERSFLYMPLMHAENVDLQHKCVAAFERLHTTAPQDLRHYIANSVDYAKRHAEIVERFGRFPHRNAILGRASTTAETEFLSQPGSSF